MNLIELHILQSFPVTCLNRDDVGSPKSALFGGVQRARVSSQSQKRAIRLDFNESHYGNAYHTTRTKLAHEGLIRLLENGGMARESAEPLAVEVLASLVDTGGAANAKKDKNGRMNLPTLVWLSPAQLKAAADAILDNKDAIGKAISEAKTDEKNKKKEAEAVLKKVLKPANEAIQKAGISDAADIALFGRMVANDPSLNVEAAAMFSHALSTHNTSNEVDFYSAVDDVKQVVDGSAGESEEAGAAMIGTLEYNSATYYRYVGINLDILFSPKHLGPIEEQEKRKILLRAFITACLTAVPGARKNSMNGATLPVEVLGIRKEKGQPLQLINAFESPVKAKGAGYAEASKAAMTDHLKQLEATWGVQGEKVQLSELNPADGKSKLDLFLDQLLQADV